jgi:hypothetical protein
VAIEISPGVRKPITNRLVRALLKNEETFHILVKIFSLSEMNTYQAQRELQKKNNTGVKKFKIE